MRHILLALVLAAGAPLALAQAPAPTQRAPVTAAASLVGAVQVCWLAPTANANGSVPVTPLSGYTVFQGAAAPLAAIATVSAATTCYTTAPLPPGTYFFGVKSNAVNGTQSAMSSPFVSAVVSAPAKPGAPSHITIGATI